MPEFGLQASSFLLLRRDIDRMERLQRLAWSMVKSLRGISYEERLRRMNLFTIERRLLRGDLILACNLFQDPLNGPPDKFLDERNLRLHDFQLRHRCFRLARRRAAFSVRLPNHWNRLLLEEVTAYTVEALKQLLDSTWIFIFPRLP